MLANLVKALLVVGMLWIGNERSLNAQETIMHGEEAKLCRLSQGIDVTIGDSPQDIAPNTYETLDQLYASSLDIHPSGDYIAIAGRAGIYLFDAYTRAFLRVFVCVEFPARDMVIRWSPDGTLLAAYASPLLGISIYDTATGIEIAAFNPGEIGVGTGDPPEINVVGLPYYDIAWSPDSQRLAAIGSFNGLEAGETPTGLWVWDIDNERIVFEAPLYPSSTPDFPISRSLTWSHYGGIFACGCNPQPSNEGKIYLFNGALFNPLGELSIQVPASEYRSYALDWSETNLLAVGGNEIRLQVWNMDTFQLLSLPSMLAYAVAWHPTDNHLAVSTRSELNYAAYIAILNVESSRIERELRRHERPATTLVWHPSGRYLYSVERNYLAEPRTSRVLQWEFVGEDISVQQF